MGFAYRFGLNEHPRLGEEFAQIIAEKPLIRVGTIRPPAIDLHPGSEHTPPISNNRDEKRSSSMKEFMNTGARLAIRGTVRRTVKGIILPAIAVLVVLITAASSYADCGPMAGMKFPVVRLPLVAAANLAAVSGMPSSESPDSIVGLWHTMYTADNAPFAETFKQWHSDGTEFENVNHNPAIGAVCVGVWKQVGARMVHLHHLGFLFNSDGTSAGTFVVEETDTLAARGMTYTGTFTFTTYDVNGNPTGTEIKGTVASTRITVN
jgi:hypothetical protein